VERIKQVSEAFSERPNRHYVGEEVLTHYEVNGNSVWSNIKEIKSEDWYPDGNRITTYVGYDNNGKKLFRWLGNAVNVVEFFPLKLNLKGKKGIIFH
jgi:hypothetical protein